MTLLMITLFGLYLPDESFVYYLAAEFNRGNDIHHYHLTLAFIIDAFMVTIWGSYYFAIRPIGKVRWYWFLFFSLIGSLRFSLPLYWWLNQKYLKHDNKIDQIDDFNKALAADEKSSNLL